ncbi:MAG: hypothetical protein JST12_06710 [Armatimonadetes bacterium]|nr:hypothetical protein [Armatimonadota bacterium]
MAKQRETARIHLIAAREAPVAVIIRRKPSRLFHIIRWNLRNDAFDHGSWFRGTIYPFRSDLSWDGELMSYLAMGNHCQTWNGVCRIPRLTTLWEMDNCGTYNGGGVFWGPKLFLSNAMSASEARIQSGWPRDIEVRKLQTLRGDDLTSIFHRFARDGWRLRSGDRESDLCDEDGLMLEDYRQIDAGVLFHRPVRKYPELQCRYIGHRSERSRNLIAQTYPHRTGYIFHFELEGYPDILGPSVDWATRTNKGDLIWTREGIVYRISMEDLKQGKKPKSFDLNDLQPPEIGRSARS